MVMKKKPKKHRPTQTERKFYRVENRCKIDWDKIITYLMDNETLQEKLKSPVHNQVD